MAGALALAVAAVSAATTAWALDPRKDLTQYSTARWNSDTGLPNNTVQSIAQTPDGYLWVATLEGVARFDGHEFRVFDSRTTPQIPRNDIQMMLAARDGSLWLGAYGGGLVQHRQGTFRSYSREHRLPVDTIRQMAEDPEGGLWIGTEAGLFRLKDDTVVAYTEKDGLSSEVIRSVFVDRSGTLWVGTRRGLDRRAGGRFVACTSSQALPGRGINVISEDSGGRIWVGTDEGIERVDGGGLVGAAALGALHGIAVNDLLFDRAGLMWIATDRGLRRVKGSRIETLAARDGLPDDSVAALLEDRDGSLWVGTAGGLVQLKDGPIVTFAARQGLSSEQILTVAPAAAGGIWLGSNDGTLDRLVDGGALPLEARGPLQGSRVLAVLDEGNALWVGTELGLHHYAGGRWTRYGVERGLPSSPVRSLLRDRRGRLWVGTDGGGLARFDGSRFVTLGKAEGLVSPIVRGLLEARDGTLWAATYGGLCSVGDEGTRCYTTADGLSHDLVRSLYEDAQGVLWVGTYGGGLNRLADGRFVAITTRQGLFDDVVYQIVEDKAGYLWMSSNKGISRVRRSDLDAFAAGALPRVSAVPYGRADGMRSAECNGGYPAGVLVDGRIWFATTAGVAAVDPAQSTAARASSPPVLQEVEVDGTTEPLGSSLVLGPGTRRFRIRFTSIDLLAPDRTRFAFFLEGFEQAWVDAGRQQFAEYTQLAPGSYRFRLRAMGADGVWREAEDPLAVRVRGVWYRTRASALAAILAALCAAWVAHRLRLRAHVAHERELSERVEEALARVKVLSGLLPICASCKNIRDDGGYWKQIESYIHEHSEATFSHGICPACAERLYPEASRRLREKGQRTPDEGA